MICKTCADAAARRAPRSEHCTYPTCPCGHRDDQYRTAPAPQPASRREPMTVVRPAAYR